MSRRHVNGFTLPEVSVSIAFAAMLALLALSMSGGDAKMHQKVIAFETLQEFEIGRLKEFSDTEKFEKGFNQDTDGLLQKCRAHPCDDECLKASDWRPLAWNIIPIYLYKVLAEDVNDGGRFRYSAGKFERCVAFPRTFEDDLRGSPPRYPDACVIGARAEWRSGPYGSIEYRFNLWDSRYALRRTLLHYENPYGDGQSRDCQEKKSVSCEQVGSYFLNVDLQKTQATCASPVSEENYK